VIARSPACGIVDGLVPVRVTVIGRLEYGQLM
jgi:hypothetical protein